LEFNHYGKGIVNGMRVTLRHLFRHAITTQYPEERIVTSRRTRGNELVWDRALCTGCSTCAKSCPQGAIEIVTSTSTEMNKYKVETYRVDTGYCIQCGLCVEACPYHAVYLGYSYERAKYRRGELVQSDDMLMASDKRPASGYMYPEIAEKLPQQTLLIYKDQVKK
jgi:formate hydrogenlyase subunit 6/NADH:ubiquinone oxidoreductase subunit I